MKYILTTLAIFVSSFTYSQSYKLTVNIANFKNNQGKVMVAVYTGKDNFLKKATFRKSTTINTNAAKIVFEGIPDGEYAISLFHDENNNNKYYKSLRHIGKKLLNETGRSRRVLGL